MPYVPSKKTDGKSEDREVLDKAVEAVAKSAADSITDNSSLLMVYRRIFICTASSLNDLLCGREPSKKSPEVALAKAILEVSEKYGYDGAELGEFNYAFTRFIQRVPQIKVERGDWNEEIRYWLYARTVAALTYAIGKTAKFELGIDGVLEDIKDEYKRRVNTAYEAAQIVKSGDCYDTPYYTRLVEVMDEEGNHIGHMEVMLKRSEETVNKDLLDGKLVLKR